MARLSDASISTHAHLWTLGYMREMARHDNGRPVSAPNRFGDYKYYADLCRTYAHDPRYLIHVLIVEEHVLPGPACYLARVTTRKDT